MLRRGIHFLAFGSWIERKRKLGVSWPAIVLAGLIVLEQVKQTRKEEVKDE